MCAQGSVSPLVWGCERTLPEALSRGQALLRHDRLDDLGQLLDGRADLLSQRALGKVLLRKLSQDVHDMLRQVGARRQLILQIRVEGERALLERALCPLQVRIRLSGEGILLGTEWLLAEWLLGAEWILHESISAAVAAVCAGLAKAGLSKKARSYLRDPRRLETGELGHQSLWGVL